MAGEKPNNFPVRTVLDGTEEVYTQTNDVPEKFTTQQIADLGWTETIVSVSAVEIQGLSLSPKDLLPTPGSGKYYEFDKFIFEFDYGTTKYTSGGKNAFIISQGSRIASVDVTLVTGDSDRVAVVTAYIPANGDWGGIGGGNPQTAVFSLNQKVTLGMHDVPTLKDGNGTMRILMRYRVRTFGF